jgi:hypothetical protein
MQGTLYTALIIMQGTLYTALITRKAINIPGEGHAYLELHNEKGNV